MKRFLISLVLSIPFMVSAAGLSPISLKCQYFTNPEAVDEKTPRLSWINQMLIDTYGEHQTAWQIQVSSSKSLLDKGEGDVWDSGKVEGESQPYHLYAGKTLEPGRKYWWHVRVWDCKNEVSEWSESASWGTGLMGNWKAQWIGAPWDAEGPRDIIDGQTLSEKYPSVGDLSQLQKLAPSTPAPIFKKSFRIDKSILSARLYTTGLGYFQWNLNGKEISHDVLSPNQTDYTSRQKMDKRRLPLDIKSSGMQVMYLGYDLTDEIRKGENYLEYILGNGFFNSVNIWTAGYGSPRMIAQLEITYKDGSRESIISDDTWKVRESAIRSNDVFAGEVYDSRVEETPWQQAVIRKAPEGRLVAQSGPTDKVMGTIQPTTIEKLQDGSYKIMFAEEIAGRVRLSEIAGKDGDTINVRFLNGSVADYDYNGTMTYVCNGKKGEYTTSFCWFVFDGCIVSGWNGELTSNNIIAEKISSDVELCATFKCSDPVVESIVKMWQRTQINNMHGSVPTDCPHRERGPYTGDGQLTSAMVMHNFDARTFYLKWISDIANSQDSESGYVPNSSPWEPGCGGGVAWGAAMTIIPWEYYLAYGDSTLLRQCYGRMKAQTDYMRSWMTRRGTMVAKVPGFCMNIGEHVPPFTSPSEEFMHTFVWWQCCDIMYMAAEALGLKDDAYRYYDLCGDILMQFIAEFYNADQGSYGNDQCDVMALRMGVLDKKRVVEDLRKKLQNRNGHILTGYVGTRIFFETLSEYGLNDEAWHALTAKGYPGYADMVEKGSTTMWEQWDGKHSHDHPGLGSGLVWLYRNLVGVKTDRTKPGYKHFTIDPYIPSNLTYASYTLETPYGELSSGWKKGTNGIEMDIIVPEGCTCTLTWPEDDRQASGNGIIRDFEGTYTLKSGTYHLTSSPKVAE